MFRYLFAILVLTSSLYSYCTEPREPSCISSSIAFETLSDFCRSDVEDYIRDLEEYSDCVLRESYEKAKEALDKYNCYASGEDFCF